MANEHRDEDSAKTPREETRKPYSEPQVTRLGSLEEITTAVGSGTKDGPLGSVLL